MSKTYSVSPKTEYIHGLAGAKWSVPGAISELVDNSFGELRGNAAKVDITYDTRSKTMIVHDNGRGMKHIGDLFRLGQTAGIGPNDIGRYGSGGTLALVWLASHIRIWTLREGKVMRDDVTWSDWLQYETLADCYVNDKWEAASLSNTPQPLFEAGRGTYIELTIRRERIITPDVIQKELSRTYAPALRHHRILNWTTISRRGGKWTQRLQDNALVMPADQTKRVNFDIVLDFDGQHLPVKGAVGLIEDLSYAQSVISVGFGSRVIMRTRDCYVSEDGEQRYTGTGVAGWLDLGMGWQEYLTTTKDEIKDDPLRAKLMQHVFTEIEPLLQQVDEDQGSLILDGIALELQGALNGLSDKLLEIEVDTHPYHYDNPSPTPATPSITPRPTPVIDPKDTPSDDPGVKVIEKPAVSKINIKYTTDEHIGQVLCRMEVTTAKETNFVIEVNKDHEVVQELLKSRPVQKLALNLMLTREIASALFDNEEVLKKVLPKLLFRQLENIPQQAQRERMLARVLMDSARRPTIIEEEAA